MRQSRIDYGRLVEGALRGVVRDVLGRVSREGLPSPHHFYITFRTPHPDVVMPDFLRERYPTEMTVVLQHQFWDLEADEDGFSVTLSFNDQLHRLHVPYLAIKVFADPGTEFGLQFTLEQEAEVMALPTAGSPPRPAAAGSPSGLLVGPTPAGPRAASDASEASEEGGAEIVSLDRFRRK